MGNSLDDGFAAMAPDTITLRRFESDDGYGDPTYAATTTTYKARVAEVGTRAAPSFFREVGGEIMVSRVVAWVFDTPGISEKDKVTLPDGTSPPLLAVERYPDEDGAYYEKLHFA